MAGFSIFNQTTTTTPFVTPSLNTTPAFGASPQQQNLINTTPAFGASPQQQNLVNTTPAFGASPQQQNLMNTTTAFSAPPQQQNVMNTAPAFGAPPNQQNVMNTTSAFGALPQQQSVTFGSTPTPAFESTSATNTSGFSILKPQFGSPSTSLLGTPSTTTTQAGLSFGSSAQSGGLAQAQSKPAFGTLGFGSTPTSLSFSPTSTTSQTGTSFSTLNTTPQTGIAFGTPASTSNVPQTGITFGTPTSTATTAPQTGLSFGIQSAPAQTGTLSTTPVTSAPSLFTGLGSGTLAPPSSTTSLFGSVSSAVTTPSTTTSGGIFSWQKPTTDSGVTVSSSATSIGLGGVDHSAVTTTQSSANTIMSVKEQQLPNEIQQTVLAFKEHVKTQKNLSSEVARSSAEPLTKLTQQITALNNLIINLASMLSQQKFTAEKIKFETIKSLNDYELVQKIKDSPVASEERLLSIRKYFTEKISSFEESTKVLQAKIEYVYQHVSTLPQENSLSAEALKMIVKKLHDSFVVIGARAYKLHNDMLLLKVQYMTLRNQYVKDNSSISLSLNRELELPLEGRAKSADLALEGPNPFSRTGNGSFNSLLLTSQNRNFAASTSSSSVGSLLNTSKPFGLSDTSGVSLFDQSISLSAGQQFNLQNPPFGNKREHK